MIVPRLGTTNLIVTIREKPSEQAKNASVPIKIFRPYCPVDISPENVPKRSQNFTHLRRPPIFPIKKFGQIAFTLKHFSKKNYVTLHAFRSQMI